MKSPYMHLRWKYNRCETFDFDDSKSLDIKHLILIVCDQCFLHDYM